MKSPRTFKVWEYQISLGQLLVRSPKAPATTNEPEQVTNLDVVFLRVEYLAVPRLMRGLELATPTNDEVARMGQILGRPVRADEVKVLVSGEHRHIVVAASASVSENDWDILDSPFEFRSHARANSQDARARSSMNRGTMNVQVHLLPTSEGGRAGPLLSGYRSLLRFEGSDVDIGFELELDRANGLGGVAPGSSGPGRISFLALEKLPSLIAGQRFEIREGARVVGRGIVIDPHIA